MKHFLTYGLFLILASCNNSQMHDVPQNENNKIHSTNNQEDKSYLDSNSSIDVYSNQSDENDTIQTSSAFSCIEANKEFQFYKNKGKVELIEDKNIVCSYADDSLDFKLLFVDCKLVYRSIRSTKNAAYSFSKYDNNTIMLFDSSDSKGNHIIFYDRAVNKVMYKGKLHKPGIEFLPKYIQVEINNSEFGSVLN